jgi:hypothetical protein
MAKQNWVSNRYLTATYRNYSRAATIGNDVLGALEEKGATSVPIQALATYFAPINTAFQNKAGALSTADGIKEGATLGLKQRFEALRSNANEWRKAIAYIYDEHTPEYKALLPNGIGPFTTGKQADKLTEILGFSGRLAGDPTLATVKTAVDLTYAELTEKNLNQKGKVTARGTTSEELEDARIALCNGLLYVEAGLTQIFINNLEMIDEFFPLELLRRRPQTEFTGAVAANALKNIVRRKLPGDEEIDIKNIGTVDLRFYFAPTPTTPWSADLLSVSLAPNTDTETTAALLGASEDNVYLMVANDSLDEGHWQVMI